LVLSLKKANFSSDSTFSPHWGRRQIVLQVVGYGFCKRLRSLVVRQIFSSPVFSCSFLIMCQANDFEPVDFF